MGYLSNRRKWGEPNQRKARWGSGSFSMAEDQNIKYDDKEYWNQIT